MSVVRGHSKKTSCRDIIEADKASIRKGIYKVLRTGMAAMTHLLILRKSSIWPRRAEDILTVVVVDIGPWVLPPSLNCSLAPCPSTLTQLALWAELFQQKIQSTVAEADRREPTVRLLMVQLQLAVKEGTISYSILFRML